MTVATYISGVLYCPRSNHPKYGEDSKSLQFRRLFYVGTCCAIAVIGKMPSRVGFSDLLNLLAIAVMEYERSDNFELPAQSLKEIDFYTDTDTTYVIMTKQGLYYHGCAEFQDMDDDDIHSFGYRSDLMRLCLTKLKTFDAAFQAIRAVDKLYFDVVDTFSREQIKSSTYCYCPEDDYERYMEPTK